MTLTLLSDKKLVADIRRRLSQGYAEATAERVRSIAAGTSDVELLRQLVDALAEAVANPKPRKRGRPSTQIPLTKDGAFDLDAMPARTAKESAAVIKAMMRNAAMCEEMHAAIAKGQSVDAVFGLIGPKFKASAGKAKVAYYKWLGSGSK